MTPLPSTIIGWFLRQAKTLLVIVAILLGFAWANGELKKADELVRERAELVGKRNEVQKEIDQLRLSASDHRRRMEALQKILGSALDQMQKSREALWVANFWTRKVPFSEAWLELRLLDRQIGALQESMSETVQKRKSSREDVELKALEKERDRDDIGKRIIGIDEKLEKSYPGRIRTEIEKSLPLALGILVGVILIPVGIKVFLYFIVAPLASGRAPLRLMSATPGGIRAVPVEPASGTGKRAFSAVSVPIVLGETEELLVLQDYLQSTSLHARKRTRWVLNPGLPFTSVLSGMYMLTEVSAAGLEPVVVSATMDPLMEVGILALDDGAAFVCQPRSLAGVIQDRQRQVRISRHWRLGTLQSWLTLQFRFLVFHGPCRLVLKGCRGIVAEPVGTGRLINQAATLGFDVNLDYANTRCETFVSYWSGKEELFNDLFSGQSGLYVYEEMPDLKNTSGAGRHLKGIADAFLKAFGV